MSKNAVLLILFSVVSFGLSQARASLRVVTYNVALGYPIRAEKKLPFKRRLSMARLLSTHPALRDFDILGTQEICGGNNEEQLEYFRDILRAKGEKMYSVFAVSKPNDTGKCKDGQMILSRYPIVASGSFQIPLLRPGGKVVVWADIELPAGSTARLLRVYNLHLDNRGRSFFSAKGRLKQMKAILEHYLDWRARHANEPAIILGDFNALKKLYNFWAKEAAIKETEKYLSPSLTRYKPTHVTAHQIDWIFYDKLELERSKVVCRLLSDHFPVVADFKI